MNSTDDLQRMINTILLPIAPTATREAFIQALKYFGLSYICALQGILDNLPEADPLYAQAQAALDEIEHKLMDT